MRLSSQSVIINKEHFEVIYNIILIKCAKHSIFQVYLTRNKSESFQLMRNQDSFKLMGNQGSFHLMGNQDSEQLPN